MHPSLQHYHASKLTTAMGKSDRAVVFGTLGIFIGFGLIGSVVVNIVLAATAVLGVLTIFNRARQALAETQEGPRP